jgi:hypothetical protein
MLYVDLFSVVSITHPSVGGASAQHSLLMALRSRHQIDQRRWWVEMEEWIAYLDAYELHLNTVAESLATGKVATESFTHEQPKVRLPGLLRARSEALVARTQELSEELRTRMDAFSTVLRYSRMKDPDRIVLIDVLA